MKKQNIAKHLKKEDIKMWKKIKNFFMDWVWQLPQNLCGLVYKAFRKDISNHWYSEPNHAHIFIKDKKKGVTLGKYIFVYKGYNNLSYIVAHETGHVRQSRILGPLYLLVIGLPSIIWADIHKKIAPDKSYYWFYTEAWANKLAGI